MKKIYILSIVILMFILYSCSSKTLNISDLEPSNIVVDYDTINATVKEDPIKSSKENITLVLKNKTKYEYFYGVDFELEVELDDNWYKIPFHKNPEFIEISMVLNGNSESNEEIELSKYFSDLPDGKYRILKTFYLDDSKTVVAGLFNIKK
ncbi:MAG: immunoglobulin-like domain-containing protein [Clostridium septicum]|uniref:immunoglobulin-like domain-containing protein n=1 Tax=Clostridium septicum TaxID=1504 RepID=UPI002585A4EB|nr:immunoglobulin-like domain-containing protein [Clostridium septicum]MDU1314077.1 immunoglobulin-like domain-containing protein [Clostridium septicum]